MAVTAGSVVADLSLAHDCGGGGAALVADGVARQVRSRPGAQRPAADGWGERWGCSMRPGFRCLLRTHDRPGFRMCAARALMQSEDNGGGGGGQYGACGLKYGRGGEWAGGPPVGRAHV